MKRHSTEEIIAKLRQAEADLAQGLSLATDPEAGQRPRPVSPLEWPGDTALTDPADGQQPPWQTGGELIWCSDT